MAELEALRSRQPGVRVTVTAAYSAGLRDARLDMTRRMEVYFAFRGKSGVSYPSFVCRLADEAYKHTWEYVWRGHRFCAVALSGHTPGSAGILLGEDTLPSGDYLIPGEEVVLRLPSGGETDYRVATEPVPRGLSPGLYICPGHREPYIPKEKE